MSRRMALVILVALCILTACDDHARRTDAHQTGRLVFVRGDPASGAGVTYLVDLQDNRLTKVFGRGANLPHWSPDGREISIFCCDDGMAAHIVDARTRSFRELPPTDAQLETHCGPWSADGRRLACESFGVTEAGRTGIYSIRAGDGQGLQRITANPQR